MYAESRESAVSEVIAVILVVALTVIMAAVVAAFAMGISHGAPRSHTVAVTVTPQPDGSHLLTYHGGPDHLNLASLTVNDGTPAWETPEIGESRTVPAGHRHIVVTGQFFDSPDQIVLDTTIG
jgi:FlaG/FlaF family flagellin (archaellin)